MDAERKRMIVEALRGGKYHQGRSVLRPTGDTYCCLGVICDLSGLGRWELRDHGGCWAYHVGVDTNAAVMPAAVMEWSGIDYDRQRYLATMNDGGKTFEDIATYIEDAF